MRCGARVKFRGTPGRCDPSLSALPDRAWIITRAGLAAITASIAAQAHLMFTVPSGVLAILALIVGLVNAAVAFYFISRLRRALALSLTLETVKWNVKNILAKLGVSSRYDAMTWARKKGLIE